VKTIQLTYEINGESWNFYLMSTSSYNRKFGKGSSAICTFKDKTVHFHLEEFNPNVVAHELTHILVYQSPHGSADVSSLQLEEIFCEILHNNWMKLNPWIVDIYTKLSECALNLKR